jgi:microcystin-dependent protein
VSYLIQVRSDTSANWQTANPILAVGEIGFATDTKDLRIGDGVTAWNASGGPAPLSVPAGVISQFAGATAPSGYLLCQGQTLSTTTYANLFSTIGYTYGGTGSSFLLPNLKGRIPVGQDTAQLEFNVLGETDGAKTVAITEAQMPSHTHVQNSHTHYLPTNKTSPNVYSSSPADQSGELNSGEGAVLNAFWSWNGSQGLRPMMPLTATNQNAGGNQAHNNLQPYIVVNYIIKT